MTTEQAIREKRLVALTSVVAAVFLTGFKIVIGVLTGSLGILSEAAHSGLDLGAAIVTLFAVRVSSRPADREHTYGHGKIENLSALVETLLLLATCVWIIYEAIERLFVRSVHVDVTLWSFLVICTSIVVDYGRSRALMQTARKYKSQALEADALHFSTDIWSSTVVLFGLTLVWISNRSGIPWLVKADALAALGVACIVIYVSFMLGRRTVSALLDGVPGSLVAQVTDAVRQVPEVQDIELVRVRQSGPESFVDVHFGINRDTVLERADSIRSLTEQSVRRVLPGADVTVEIKPIRLEEEDVLTTIRLLAARHGLGAHGIRIYDRDGMQSLEMHLEVSDLLSVDQAHAVVTEFERELKNGMPQVTDVVSHIEPIGESSSQPEAPSSHEDRVLEAVRDLPEAMSMEFKPHDIRLHNVRGEIQVSFHCELPPDIRIVDAHSLTEKIERNLRSQVPNLGRIVIHVEPPKDADNEQD